MSTLSSSILIRYSLIANRGETVRMLPNQARRHQTKSWGVTRLKNCLIETSKSLAGKRWELMPQPPGDAVLANKNNEVSSLIGNRLCKLFPRSLFLVYTISIPSPKGYNKFTEIINYCAFFKPVGKFTFTRPLLLNSHSANHLFNPPFSIASYHSF